MDNDLIQKIAKNIKKYRKLRKYSQARLAVKAGIVPSTLGSFELARHDITVSKLQAIAKGLDVTISDLIED